MAVDGAGNVFLVTTNDTVEEVPHAFVPSGSVTGNSGGRQRLSLAAVLPTNQSLTGIFAPTSDAQWLTINGVSGGTVHFSFAKITGAAITHSSYLAARSRDRGHSIESRAPTFAIPSKLSIPFGTTSINLNRHTFHRARRRRSHDNAQRRFAECDGNGRRALGSVFDTSTFTANKSYTITYAYPGDSKVCRA